MVAAVLGGVFVGVGALARRAALREERDEMAQAFATVVGLRLPRFSMQELSEAGPSLSARVTDAEGRLVASRGRMPEPLGDAMEGFHQRGAWLYLVRRARDERVVLAQNLVDIERGLDDLELALAILWLPLSLLVGGATWLAANSVFRPLDRLAEAAAAIEGSDLSRRLPVPDAAEFGALAQVLNRMLGRIEESAQRSERFAADAAHELRTPLAIVRTRIETTLLARRSEAEHVASHREVLAELDRVVAIAEALLRTARGADGSAPEMDLAPAVRAAGERFGHAELRLAVESAWARILPEELDVVVDNLLANARRFAPEGTPIGLSLLPTAEGSEIRVVDHGPGIRPEEAERVFDRFYRADEHRNRASGGAGIGLALCRRIVVGRGGTIVAEATPGGGTTIVVRLPGS